MTFGPYRVSLPGTASGAPDSEAQQVLRLSSLGATAIGPDLGSTCKWRHGAVAWDGQIYAFPWQAEAILVVNPVTSGVRLEGELGASRDGQYGFTVATTSYACGVPWAATQVWCAASTGLIRFGQLSSEPGKWRTAAAHQERIYALPVQADGVLEIQPLEQKLRQLDHVAAGASLRVSAECWQELSSSWGGWKAGPLPF